MNDEQPSPETDRNPAKKHEERLINDSNNLEPADKEGSDSVDQVRNQEQNPNQEPTEDFKYNEKEKVDSKVKVTGKDKFKRAGPITALATTLVFSFLGIGGSFVVSSPITMFSEVIKEKFDFNKPIFAQRVKNNFRVKLGKLLKTDIDSLKSDFMNKKKSRLETMSDDQIKGLEENNFEVKSTDSPSGRNQIDSIAGNGVELEYGKVRDLQASLDAKPAAEAAFNVANKSDFGLNNDIIKNKISSNLNIEVGNIKSVADVDDIDSDGTNTTTDSEMVTEMDNQLNDNVSGRRPVESIDSGMAAKNNGPIDQSQIDPDAQKLIADVDQEIKSSPTGNSNQTSSSTSKLLGGVMNIADKGSTVCGLYAAYITAINFSKIQGAVQLIRYGTTFIKMAEMIKAGDATEEEISYVGSKLMAMVAVDNSDVSRNALDSYGFKYAAQGKAGDITLDTSASYFQNSSNKEVSSLYKVLKSWAVPGTGLSLASACGLFKSGFMKDLSIGASIGMIFYPPFWAGLTIGALGYEALEMVAQSALGWLGQQWIASATGLKVSSNTMGQDSGNAVVSGMMNYYNINTAASGGGLLKKPAAASYALAQREIVAQEAKVIQATTSPFDTSTRHTFLGSIVFGLLPHYNTINTISGQIRSLASLAASSLSAIMPTSKALAMADDLSGYEQCFDGDYTEGKFKDVAFSPFCTPIRGFPIEVLYTPEEAVKYGFEPDYASARKRFAGDFFQTEDVFNFFADADNYKLYFKIEAGQEMQPSGPLKIYGENCVNRNAAEGPVPFGAPMNVDDSTDTYEYFFGKNFQDGSECILEAYDPTITSNNQPSFSLIVNGDLGKTEYIIRNVRNIMFGLYYADERVQCLLDEGKDCQIASIF